MISRLLLGAVGLAALSTASLAADLPSRRAPPVYIPPVVPVFTWTGFYAGINAGYGFDGQHSYDVTANDAIAAPGLAGGFVQPSATNRGNGFTGGGQIGYNYQLGNVGLPALGSVGGGGLVVGIEADAAYTDNHSSSDFVGNAGDITSFRSRTDYVGTVRGRLGYAFDRFLVYGTGGFAYGNVHDSVGITVVNPVYFGSSNAIRTGYAYGGGVEYALPTGSFLNFLGSSAVTVKAEFIHYDLGTTSLLVPGLPGTFGAASSFSSRVHTDGNLVRAGLNYKFGDVVAPVVARY